MNGYVSSMIGTVTPADIGAQIVLYGTPGQVVGFDEGGNAVAQNIDFDSSYMQMSVYDPTGKSQDIFAYVDTQVGNISSILDSINGEVV